MNKPEPMVVTSPEVLTLPEGQRFFTENVVFDTKKGMPVPFFRPEEVAKVFFGKPIYWLRWRMEPNEQHPYGYFVLDGKPLEFGKNPKSGFRYFTLLDIEKMAMALMQQGYLDVADGMRTMSIVRICAQLHGYLI